MKKLIFTTQLDGLKLLKKTYLHESDVCEGEFADWLVRNIDECFDKSMKTELIMGSIQAFRQWSHNCDNLESEFYAEVITEYDRTEGSEDFQNFNYFDGTHVTYGTRIGVEIVDKVTNLTSLELDFGICYP